MAYYSAAGSAAGASPGLNAFPSAVSSSLSSDLELVAALSSPNTLPALKANGEHEAASSCAADGRAGGGGSRY